MSQILFTKEKKKEEKTVARQCVPTRLYSFYLPPYSLENAHPFSLPLSTATPLGFTLRIPSPSLPVLPQPFAPPFGLPYPLPYTDTLYSVCFERKGSLL